MKVVRTALFVFILHLFLTHASLAVGIQGGRGLPHTKAAWVMQKGHLTLSTYASFWGKVHQVKTVADDKTAYTIWDVQGLLSLNYGLGDHFGFFITPAFYKDVHRGEYDDYPWDTRIGLKIGSFGSKASSLNYGVELNARFPTGERHNILYHPYNAGSVGFGFTGLVSYALDPLYPEDALNIHANLGYFHHNDVGDELTRKIAGLQNEVLHPTQEGSYALGFMIPTQSFDYTMEMYGNFWLQQPPETAAGREVYSYFAASVVYKPYRWFDFIVSGEYRLTSDKEETVGPLRSPSAIPNYNTWRVNVGAKFVLLPTSVYRTSERDVLMQRAQNRRELFEQIIRDRRETESAEEELERIREERRKAERELERLRRILEGQKESSENLESLRQNLEPN
jgi:hypothetical protein